jgi:hypothetical protein
MDGFEQHLAAAVVNLPPELAASMEGALGDGSQTIRAGRYDTGAAMCPLAAADAYAEAQGRDRFDGAAAEAGYGGKLLRFALCFDLCAERWGIEIALAVTRAALAGRTGRLMTPV